jgi:hypothetical protein
MAAKSLIQIPPEIRWGLVDARTGLDTLGMEAAAIRWGDSTYRYVPPIAYHMLLPNSQCFVDNIETKSTSTPPHLTIVHLPT